MAEKTDRRTTVRLQNKVNTLRELKSNKFIDRLVHNLSSKRLTHPQLTLLQRDVGHNLMDAHLLDFIAALEPALHHMEMGEDSRGFIKQQVTGLLMRHKGYQTLSKDETEAVEQLKKDDTIIVLPADKGRATVVMDRALYVTKALELLDDKTAYKIVKRDPMVAMRNKINKVLDGFKRAKK